MNSRGRVLREGSAIVRLYSSSTSLSFAPAVLVLVLLASLASGCLGGAWGKALREDSIAGYYRFLRDHPDSRYTAEAQERLAFHKLERAPSLDGYIAFRDDFPASELLAKVRPLIEEKAFAAAQAAGSADDFDRFVREFPGGELAERAIGNAAYLRAGGFETDVDALQRFAQEHPNSDFAVEARRSAEAARLRPTTRISRVGLRVEVSPSVAERERLTRTFIDHARKTYARSGVRLVPAQPGQDAAFEALLRIRHTEEAGSASSDDLSGPAVTARTIVSLEVEGRDVAAWRREFTLRVDQRDHDARKSVLFEPRGVAYWGQFFVPVASWASDSTLRAPLAFDRRVTGLDAVGDRAVVAFEDGSFEVHRLADPARPERIAVYRPKSRLESRERVRVVGDRIVLFGEDGVQVVAFGASGPEVAFELGRGVVGAIDAVEPRANEFVVAGSQGLVWVAGDGSGTRRLMSRRVRALASVGSLLVVSDGESIYAATPQQFIEGRVTSQFRLAVGFNARRLRSFGGTVLVLGDDGALVVDFTQPARPRVVSQIYSSTVGPLVDAARVGSRAFLLGTRGLLVMAPGLGSIEEALDVQPGEKLVPMGRHLVAIGGAALQVVDATPYTASRSASRPAQRETRRGTGPAPAAPAAPGPPAPTAATAHPAVSAPVVPTADSDPWAAPPPAPDAAPSQGWTIR